MAEMSVACHHFPRKYVVSRLQKLLLPAILDACKDQPVGNCQPAYSFHSIGRELKFKPAQSMILRLTLLFVAGALLSNCAYPFGHSKNGNYYGGQGMGTGPRTRVPKEVQRERSMF